MSGSLTLSKSVRSDGQALYIPGFLKMKQDSDYRIMELIAEGGFSKVYQGKLEINRNAAPVSIAIKISSSNHKRDEFRFEVAIS